MTSEVETIVTPPISRTEPNDIGGGYRPTAYKRWQAAEGVSIIEGFYVPDLTTVPVTYWKRLGALATFLDLEGTEEWNDAYVCEIPPGESTLRQAHLYEELVYVLRGTGITTIRNRDEHSDQQFEWGPGAVFSIPPDAQYRHFNTSNTESIRYVAVTSAPLVMNLFHNEEFVFDNDFVFRDRYAGESGHFSGSGTRSPNRVWETNFVPDVRGFALEPYPERGADGTNIKLEIGTGTLTAHISEFPVGTYKKSHRHGPGAHVIILSGTGYSLMWPDGTEKEQFDWQPGSLVVPPGMWFHQHFNTGSEPARYLAIRWGSQRYPLFSKSYGTNKSLKLGGDQIEYEDEDKEVSERYLTALAQNGVLSRMDS